MSKTRILIADDDRMLRGLLEHKLAFAGYEVISVGDGGEALSVAQETLPSLIVLDAMMPVMDGFEVLRRLKNDPQTKAIPIVMLTARRSEQDIVGALQLGAADYLIKPFIPDELVVRIQRLASSEFTSAPAGTETFSAQVPELRKQSAG